MTPSTVRILDHLLGLAPFSGIDPKPATEANSQQGAIRIVADRLSRGIEYAHLDLTHFNEAEGGDEVQRDACRVRIGSDPRLARITEDSGIFEKASERLDSTAFELNAGRAHAPRQC